jgi:FkbM family methyltransferase
MTLLDLGCNILDGFNCLKQYEVITENDRKFFVEPNPECWEEIEQKLTTIPNSTLIRKAVHIADGMVDLITRSDVSSDIAATIIGREYLESNLAKCNMFVDDFNTYKIESTTIESILREHNIIPHDTILKMDIEGMEYDILNDILQHNFLFKKIYCEFHIHNNDDIQKKLALANQFANKNIQIVDWH